MKGTLELTDILRELYIVSGFRISVHDLEFKEIAAYPTQISKFCSLIQENKKGRNICLDTDQKSFERVKREEEVWIYQCPFGLYEAVAPLYHFGVLVGYLMMGQTLDSFQNSLEHVKITSAPYVEDLAALDCAVHEIPSSNKEKILACISIMRICSEYITLTNRLNLSDRNLAHETQKYIRRNFSQKLSIERICEHFLCSKSTLMNTFRNTYGTTINRYLNEVRLEQAVKLILQSGKTIGEISEECGFSDQNYFSKVFFKEYGITPTKYRMENPPCR